MAWHRPYDSDEVEYIRAQWGRMSAMEIAERLGRSKRGVNNKAKVLGLGEPAASAGPPATRPATAPRAAGDDPMLGDLVELRALIRAQMLDAGPQALARLSAEYREVLEAIDRRKTGDGSSTEPQGVGVGQVLLSFGVSAPDAARGPGART